MADRPLHEVFLPKVQDIAHACAGRVWRCPSNFGPREPFYVDQLGDGDAPTLRYHWVKDQHLCVAITNITPVGVGNMLFGEQRTLDSEQIGSTTEYVDNVDGVADIDVNFRDLFSETDSEESSKSAGGSVKVSTEAGVEGGGASFKVAVEAEAHTEIESSQGKDVTREDEGDEGTTVPVGTSIEIDETREKSDVEIPVTGEGQFNFGIDIGKHSGGKYVGHHNGHWGSKQNFYDVVRGDAPDNWSLARSFKSHPIKGSRLYVLDPLDAAVAYTVKFEGRIVRKYKVKTLAKLETQLHPSTPALVASGLVAGPTNGHVWVPIHDGRTGDHVGYRCKCCEDFRPHTGRVQVRA